MVTRTLPFVLFVVVVLSLWCVPARAAEAPAAPSVASPSVVFFYQNGCPDCERVSEVLDALGGDLPPGSVVRYEIGNATARRLFQKLQKAYGIQVSSVPVVFIGDRVFTGAGRAQELAISDAIERCVTSPCSSPLDRVPPDVFPWVDLLELALLGAAVVLLALLQRP